MHGLGTKTLLAAGGMLALLGGGHLSLSDFAFLLIGAGWLIAMLRDWRPIRALREENAELRTQVQDMTMKCSDLEKKLELLEKSRDFGTAFEPLLRAIDQARSDASHEHEKILGALDELSKGTTAGLGEIAKGLSQNTAATATLAAGINAGTIPRGPEGATK